MLLQQHKISVLSKTEAHTLHLQKGAVVSLQCMRLDLVQEHEFIPSLNQCASTRSYVRIVPSPIHLLALDKGGRANLACRVEKLLPARVRGYSHYLRKDTGVNHGQNTCMKNLAYVCPQHLLFC